MVFIPESENIYFSKTREYFNEVLSSYGNGNYRSAVVMLYSVVICDMLFKLQELKDMYNDTVALEILTEVEKCRNTNDNKSKSKWEKELVDNIYNKTELLDLEGYTNLNHLFDHRNFSAHPALNENYELISPSRESTIAHIRNMIESILTKPPIFVKNIIEMLTEDLDEKRELYEGQPEKLNDYLNRKYFSKMSISMKKKTFKAYWKFCFCLPNDEDCKRNIKINRAVLEIIFNNNTSELMEFMKSDALFATTSPDETCTMNLCIFLSKYPLVFSQISEDTKLQIDSLIEKNRDVKVISWFKSNNKRTHIVQLMGEGSYDTISENAINHMASQYENEGLFSCFIDYCIAYFSKSHSFDNANSRFLYAISPFLTKMNKEQYISIMEAVNSNDQNYNRKANYEANTEVMIIAKYVIDETFDFKEYPHFKFNHDMVYGPNDVKSDLFNSV